MSEIGFIQKKKLKVIKSVLFTIANHEKDILAVGYEKKNNSNTRKMESIKYYAHKIFVTE